jgi:hypothetical protein
MKYASTVVALVLLAACASKPITWQKAGAAEATLADDTHGCHSTARHAPSPYPIAPRSAYATTGALSGEDTRMRFEQEEFRRCMEGKGYSQTR